MKPLSVEIIKSRLPEHVSIDETTYTSANKKARFVDKDFGDWWAVPSELFKKNRKIGHPKRNFGAMGLSERLTIEEIKARLPNHISIDESTYVKASTKARFIDSEFGEWWAVPTTILTKNTGHPKRGLKSMSKSLTLPLEEIKAKLPPHVVIDESTYKNTNVKARFIDSEFGEWWAPPSRILQGGDHPKRGFLKISESRSISKEEIISRLPSGVEIDFSTFVDTNTKCRFVDEKYGEWWAFPWNVLKENGTSHPMKWGYRSKQEESLAQFIKKYVEIKQNIKAIPNLKGLFEADIFIPSKSLIVDYHGLWCHNESFKDKKYHLLKREHFESGNYRIIQVMEDEWLFKTEIVKSLLLFKMGFCSIKYYARELKLREVNRLDASVFLEENHLMGKYRSAKYIGLYENDNLVCLLGYHVRKGILEIARFCNKNYTTAVGGFSKLLKFAEEKEKPNAVVSWVDLRYGTGYSLISSGFTLEKITIGWKWTDTKHTYNRLRCRANMDSRRLTEKQHAEELKWLKIYDAGQAKFVKTLK